jgi:hypothetical protein
VDSLTDGRLCVAFIRRNGLIRLFQTKARTPFVTAVVKLAHLLS